MAPRNRITPSTTVAIAGSASAVTALGGVATQLPPHAAMWPTVVLLGISGVLALLAGMTKLYEVHVRRTPKYIAATTLAQIARRHPDPERSMRLALASSVLGEGHQLPEEQWTVLLGNGLACGVTVDASTGRSARRKHRKSGK
ncbi:hypothetical protein [Dactylosporangium salmoneum]|uniref:Uncharacterized protein n=1 Tax=Dactylosporangium salmoneum TaxID=53361 RepID=A0ABP5TGF5_9ACTN